MNRLLTSLTLMWALCAPAMGAGPGYYGFCPKDCAPEELTAIGSGANAFMEAAIRIDPATDPLAASLKGRGILGVRCYLRADYRQKSKGFSCVKAYTGALDGEAVSKTANFVAGWNEVYFDEPVEIGDVPVYVGYQVYETQGEPYPIAAYGDGHVRDVCYINPGRKGWSEESSRGALMIEAIIDGDDDVFSGHAIAAPFGEPLAVAPDSDFDCTLYIHNQGAAPVGSLTYSGYDAEGNLTGSGTVEFPQPLAPYGSAAVAARLRSPSAEGAAEDLYVKVTEIDGQDAKDSMGCRVALYVSSDVFYRVPLVEEFTGLRCTNCPFMFYYLDSALEAYELPHVYVSHHAGFVEDILTKPCDESLLYLFGDGGSYNPAVMYDRRVMEGRETPVVGAENQANTGHYESLMAEAMRQPALAKVLVDSEITPDMATCRVYGSISKAALSYRDDLYVTAYLLEDDIPATGIYSQAGLDNIPEDAPDDLLERFRHRGVIRHCFNAGDNGDRLLIDADGAFDVSFDGIRPGDDWKLADCEVVAFIHKVNADDLADNYVLNAGATRFNEYAQTGVVGVAEVKTGDLRVFATRDGHITASDPDAVLEIYSLSGSRCDRQSVLCPGIYVVGWRLPDNTSGVCKVGVR